MLYEEINSAKKNGFIDIPAVPSYITDNLKFPLYEWQKEALENFLVNENSRAKRIQKGEILPPNHLMFNMATGSGKTLVMATLILYYYKEHKITNFIFFVNQNAILGKTQDNFIHKNHTKYLFKENIIIDEKRVNIREVEMFSNSTDDIQIKFTTIQKLHNDIYRESENSLLLSDLQKRNLVLIGDEAHHLNATTGKRKDYRVISTSSIDTDNDTNNSAVVVKNSAVVVKNSAVVEPVETTSEFSDISFIGELSDSAKADDIERSWETTVCHHILNKGKDFADSQNKNVLLEFTATVPETPEVKAKYEDKIIIKFGLKEFVNAGCTKHIRLVRTNFRETDDTFPKKRILQALVLNWYRFEIALKHEIPNFKPVILFRSKTIEESKQDYLNFIDLCKNISASDFEFLKDYRHPELEKRHSEQSTSHSEILNCHSERSEESFSQGDASPSVQHDTDENLQVQGDTNGKPDNDTFHQEIPPAYDANKEIFENVANFMKEKKYTATKIADDVRENFTERNVIITNSKDNKTKKEKTDSETDRLLNSLEDVHNHIRAVFTVQRLTEGWDVLNLYDIVRLYSGRDTNFKTKKAGSSTTSEVQLIGRGVRYYPFSVKEMPEKPRNRRKFDNDLKNELRVLEEFYFHSDNDSKYISELSDALKKSELIQDTREEKKFAIKKEFRADFKKMYLLCNKKVENENRRLKTLPDDFKDLSFDYNFETKTSHITNFNVNGEDENLESDLDGGKSGFTRNVHINEIPRNIVYKALHFLNEDENSYYSFENIRKRFNVSSTQDSLQFISPIPIKLTFTDNQTLESEEPIELLEMTKQFFLYTQRELEKYDHPFKATDFSLEPFESCFPFETTRMIDTTSKDYAENHQFEAKCKNYSWYALDSFYGTSEERALVDFIYNHFQNLNEKYDKIRLLRNEEVYKIFDFETGEGFQPDFLLLLHSKDGKNDYLQVFIEPKGKHLKGEDNDAWKENFLLEISRRYGFSKPFVEKSENYVLFGLPFFNRNDNEMKSKFDESFAKTLQIKTDEVNYNIEEKFLKVAEK